MRRPARLFMQVLLLSVVLNLADWPYLDEIFGTAPMSDAFSVQPANDDAGSSGSAGKARLGYQLLVGMQAIPTEKTIRLPKLNADRTIVVTPQLVLSSVPSRIDRPPT